MKKVGSYISLSELSRQFGIDRGRVSKLLEDLPFKIGPGGAHLYNRAVAVGHIQRYSRDMTQMRELRLEKLKAEVQLAKQKAADYNRDHIRVEDSLRMLDTFNKAFWGALRSSEFLSYPQEIDLENRVERAVIDSMRDADVSESIIKPREEALHAREKKFNEDLKAGRIPDTWAETFRPENDKRVWSQELGRYMTKAEIIAKWGPSAQISPIDEILDEVAEGAACG